MIGIIVNFKFHVFSNSLARSRYLSFLSHSFSFILWSAGTAKSKILQVLFFCWTGLLAEIRGSVSCPFKSHRSLPVSFSRTDAGLCIYHLFVYLNFNFLHNSKWIPIPTQWCLVLTFFSANLLHLLIMRLMVSFLSPHSLHFLFCSVLFILTSVWLVLMALCCAAIRRYSVSLIKSPFLSHFQIFSCGMLFISRLKGPWSCFPSHCPSSYQYRFWWLWSVLHRVFVYSLRVVVSMCQLCLHCLRVLFLPPFLKHCLSTSSLGCNTLYMVISFLVLWSICLSSSLVHFNEGPEYLTKGTTQVFIPLICFLQDSSVSSSFLVLLKYYFLIFLSSPLVWWCQPPRCPSIFTFPLFRMF